MSIELKWYKTVAKRHNENDAIQTTHAGESFRIYRNSKGVWVLVADRPNSEKQVLHRDTDKIKCKEALLRLLLLEKAAKEPPAEPKGRYYFKAKDGHVWVFDRQKEMKPYKKGRISPYFPNEHEIIQAWRLLYKVDDKVDATKLFWPESNAKKEEPKEMVEEVYPGNHPEPRTRKGQIVYAATGECPVTLEGVKWKQIRAWAEKVFAEYEEIGKHLSVQGLCSFARIEMPTKVNKVVSRIREIYKAEVQLEDARLRAEIARRDVKAPEVEGPGAKKATTKQATELDRFGFRVGTRAAKVNAVIDKTPRTEKEIRKLAGHTQPVGGHLALLVKRGFVKKVEGSKYRLFRKKSSES
jgi:hypothetical protein